MEDTRKNDEEKFDEWCSTIPVLDDKSPSAVKFCDKYHTSEYVMPQVIFSMLKDHNLTGHDNLMIRSLIFIQDLNRDNDIERSGFSTIMKVIAKNYISDGYFCSGSLAEGLALFKKNFDDWEFDIDIMYPVKRIRALERDLHQEIQQNGSLNLIIHSSERWPGYAYVVKPNSNELYTPKQFLDKIKNIYTKKTFGLPIHSSLGCNLLPGMPPHSRNIISHRTGALMTRVEKTYFSGPAITEAILFQNKVGAGHELNESDISNGFKEDEKLISNDTFFSREFTFTLTLDHVPCIYSPHWPSFADEFKTRPRPFNWPSQEIITKIVNSGIHLVPKAIELKFHHLNFRSNMTEQQNILLQMKEGSDLWRYSFSFAEKILSKLLSPIQRRCYLICKSMLKRFGKIQTIEASEFAESMPGLMEMDRYTTYYLKICMFWLCEEAPPSFWDESGLYFCVRTLLKKMDGYVTNQSLPNYFSSKQNLLFQTNLSETIERSGAIKRSLNVLQHPYQGVQFMLKADIFDCTSDYFPELKESIAKVRRANNAIYQVDPYSMIGRNKQTGKKQIICLQLARHFNFLNDFLMMNRNFLGEGCNIEIADYYGKEAMNILSKVKKVAIKGKTPFEFYNSIKHSLEKSFCQSLEVVLQKLDSDERLSHDELEDLLQLYLLNYEDNCDYYDDFVHRIYERDNKRDDYDY